MGNAAFAAELAGIDELEELYKLDASETEPEDGDEDEDDDEDGGMEPDVIPHG
jgi:hypothetical protein